MASPLSSAVPAAKAVKEEDEEPLWSAVPARHAVKEEDEGNVSIAPSGQVLMDQRYKDVRNEVRRLKDLIMKSQRAAGRAVPAPLPPPQVQKPPTPLTKRPAAGPPPGFAGVRRPPQKQHQPVQPQPPQESIRRASQPSPNARRVPTPPGKPQVNTGEPPLRPRSSAAAPSAAVKKTSVVCGLCGVRCNSVFDLKQHEQGRKHRNKVASDSGEMNVQCQICDVYLCGQLNAVQHYSGKRHRRRLFLSKADATGNQTT